jgi:putative ABC transport system permease protein
VLPDGLPGKALTLIAPRIDGELTPRVTIVRGRWLQPDDRNMIVISQAMLDRFDLGTKVGDTILLDVGGQRTSWQLVGVTQEFLASGAYVPLESLEPHSAFASRTMVRVTDPAQTAAVARDLETRLDDAGLDVYTLWKTTDTRKVVEDHMVLVTGLLLIMAALFAVIGGLGLASAMSLNVLDRTRELGIIRAMGATTRDVLQVIVLEGVLVGALSWAMAGVLSIPYTVLMGQVFAVLLEYPINLTPSVAGWVIWWLSILAIGALASALPAWNAARQPVAQALAYE